jgi:hypothetical protein
MGISAFTRWYVQKSTRIKATFRQQYTYVCGKTQ